MELKQLKEKVEKGIVDSPYMIFKYEDIDFLPFQYITEIACKLNRKINYLDTLISNDQKQELFFFSNDLVEVSKELSVYKTDVLDIDCIIPENDDYLIIICKEISKDLENKYKDNIINFPKLEDWQIKDFVYSIGEGIEQKKLDYLLNISGKDIYRLYFEMLKLSIFSNTEKKYVFDDCLDNGMYDDLCSYSVFNLTNAILKKDKKTVLSIYKDISKFDCDPMGFPILLYQNLRKVIKVQLLKNPTPENTGIPEKQFWAIKYSCGYYTKDQLLNMFELITSIDKKLKMGLLPVNLILDYVLLKILSM